MEWSSKCVWTAAAAAGGGLVLARWLAGAGAPSWGSETRAELTAQWLRKWLRLTPTFEQLMQDFEVEHVGADGTIRGSVSVAGPLLSADGTLHVGGLMVLIDTISSVSVTACGGFSGVSIDLGATVLAPIEAGARVVIETRVLRLGRTTAFLAAELRRIGGAGELLAVGTHTKHVGQPFAARVVHGMALRCPPLARWFQRRGLAQLAAAKVQRFSGSTMEAALDMKPMEGHPGVPPNAKGFWSIVGLHLLNGYWMCHGAASAALLAEAVRQYLAGQGYPKASIGGLSLSYLSPVPAFRPAGAIVTPLGAISAPADARGGAAPMHFMAELRGEGGQLFVRGRLTATAAPAMPPRPFAAAAA